MSDVAQLQEALREAYAYIDELEAQVPVAQRGTRKKEGAPKFERMPMLSEPVGRTPVAGAEQATIPQPGVEQQQRPNAPETVRAGQAGESARTPAEGAGEGRRQAEGGKDEPAAARHPDAHRDARDKK